MLHANTQHVITFSGEDEIDFLELIQTRSDPLFGTVSSKEGKKRAITWPKLVRKGPRCGLGKEDQGREMVREQRKGLNHSCRGHS